MAFILGNLTAISNKARLILEEYNAVEIVMPILIKYAKFGTSEKSDADEVLVKVWYFDWLTLN
jgi:hypothetical protein